MSILEQMLSIMQKRMGLTIWGIKQSQFSDFFLPFFNLFFMYPAQINFEVSEQEKKSSSLTIIFFQFFCGSHDHPLFKFLTQLLQHWLPWLQQFRYLQECIRKVHRFNYVSEERNVKPESLFHLIDHSIIANLAQAWII